MSDRGHRFPPKPVSEIEGAPGGASPRMLNELVERPESWGLPLVEGHQVTDQEWRAFQAYTSYVGAETARAKIAANAANVTIRTIWRWRHKSWWKVLFQTHVAEIQEEYHAGLLSMHRKAVKGLERVLNGDELPKGSATAIVAANNLLTKIGKKPLQDSRNITTINQNTLDNRGGSIQISARTVDEIHDADTMMKVIQGEIKLPEA